MYSITYNIILQLFFICNANSQIISTNGSLEAPTLSNPNSEEISTESHGVDLVKETGSRRFVETFVQVVTESNKLNQIFNIDLPTDEISKIYFQAFSEALAKVGAEDPPAVAKTVSDGIKYTYPRMSQNVITYAAANAVMVYLLSEGIYIDPAESNATAFADAILQHYPVNEYPSSIDLVRALSNGINDYLLPFNVYTPSRLPVVPISFTKQLYTMTDVSQPITDAKVIFSLSSNTTLGIKNFTINFLKELAASPTLKNLFNFTETVDQVSNVYNHVIRTECAELKSLDFQTISISNRYSRALSDTYATKTPRGLAIDFACGYALYAISQGYFAHSTLVTLPKELASAIESALPPYADLFAKVSAIINAYKVVANNHVELKYSTEQFSAILYYSGSELYASSKIQRPLSDSAGV